MPDCAICDALRDQIADLRERLVYAEACANPSFPAVPWEWALTREQAVVAIELARGEATLSRLAAALQLADPGGDWSIRRASDVISALSDRLEHCGWLVRTCSLRAFAARPRSTTRIHIHPDQIEEFRSAIRCEGSAFAAPIHHREIRPEQRAYRRGAA